MSQLPGVKISLPNRPAVGIRPGVVQIVQPNASQYSQQNTELMYEPYRIHSGNVSQVNTNTAVQYVRRAPEITVIGSGATSLQQHQPGLITIGGQNVSSSTNFFQSPGISVLGSNNNTNLAGGPTPQYMTFHPSSSSQQPNLLASLGAALPGGGGSQFLSSSSGLSSNLPPLGVAGSMGGGGASSILSAAVAGVNSSLANSRKPCNCTKSHCLKLYCECFAQGQLCQSCNCTNCMNNLSYEEERGRAIKMTLERNPTAFHPKIGRGEGERKHTKGCNCKRSGCLKNYCECYEAKISCSDLCRCQGCRNTEDSVERRSLMRLAAMGSLRSRQPLSFKKQLIKPPNETMPHLFITWEVIEATVNCLLSQAEDAERRDLTSAAQERIILEEFGRSIERIIDSASKAQANPVNSALVGGLAHGLTTGGHHPGGGGDSSSGGPTSPTIRELERLGLSSSSSRRLAEAAACAAADVLRSDEDEDIDDDDPRRHHLGDDDDVLRGLDDETGLLDDDDDEVDAMFGARSSRYGTGFASRPPPQSGAAALAASSRSSAGRRYIDDDDDDLYGGSRQTFAGNRRRYEGKRSSMTARRALPASDDPLDPDSMI